MIQTEIRRLIKALGYSCDGLRAALRDDAPFRLEVVLSIVIIPLALWLGDTGMERGLLVASWLGVLIAELLNCGLESITDYATKMERHPLAKKTKDVGSAAVLLATVGCAVIWLSILII